jgi:polyisoprenoid-binding protein YceI
MRRATLLAALLAVSPAGAETFRNDPAHTQVRASWLHAGFSEQSLRFRNVSVELDLEGEDFANAEARAVIGLASVDSGLDELDRMLRAADLLDAERVPEARFVSTAVERTGERSLRVRGELSLRGRTAPVTLDVAILGFGAHPFAALSDYHRGTWLGLSATARIRPADWGIGPFGVAVSEEVTIFISAEMKAE